MQADLKRRIPVLVALGVLMLLATGGPLHTPPAAEGAATVIATVPSGGNIPFHIAVNPAANLVYVTNNGSGDISILNNQPPFAAATLPIPIGGSPTGVAYDPSSNAIYVDDVTNALVLPYLAAPPFTALGPPIVTGTSPVWVVANPNNNRIYVVNQNQPDVAVFDTAAPGFPFVASLPQPPCAPGPGFPAGSVPTGVAVNPNTNQIYVAIDGLNQLWVMDGAAPWGCLPPIPVGGGPTGVTYNPANNHIYVANRFSNDVTIIDASTFTVLNPSLPVGANPWEVAVNPGMNHVYVTNSGSNNVSVIDGSTDAVVETVPVGSSPQGLAVDPANNRVFVANLNDNTISVIEDLPAAPPPPPPGPPPPAPPPAGGMEQVSLFGGTCTPVASTYPDATPIATIAGAVTPANVLQSMWEFGGTTWLGYSPQFPAASNLTQLDRLDVAFICVSSSGPGAATFERPVV